MACFDDAVKNSVPGGNLATPIAVAVGALILGKLFGGGGSPPRRARRRCRSQCRRKFRPNAPNSSVLDGLGGLIGRLTAGGAAPQVNSWVGHGPNEPIQPGQLGGALGGNVLDQISKSTGMSQQELLQQLAAVLPQVINKLTPNGRMPTLADLEQR